MKLHPEQNFLKVGNGLLLKFLSVQIGKHTYNHIVIVQRNLKSQMYFSVFSVTNTLDRRVPLKDSITTWQFTGISLSENNGEFFATKKKKHSQMLFGCCFDLLLLSLSSKVSVLDNH